MADLRSALGILMKHAAPHLSGDECRHLGQLDEFAMKLAQRAGGVALGIGCLVADDGFNPAGIGSFQDSTAESELLFLFSDLFDAVASLIETPDLARSQQHRGEEHHD
jgi:hypothetical protein